MGGGVRLHYLDWGGDGEPLVFLGGLGMSAHGFDDFAPRFTDSFRVLALTRRGYGESDQPASGYDIATLVEDLRSFVDSLGLGPVNLVGESIAGEELTMFAVKYPDRVDRLVYLDAAYDRAAPEDIEERFSAPPPPPPTAADSASPAAVRGYFERIYGIGLPEADLRAVAVFDASGKWQRDVTPDSVSAAIFGSVDHPEYEQIRAPALALYAVKDSVHQVFPSWPSLDDSSRTLAQATFDRDQRRDAWQRERFRSQVTRGRVVEIPGAHHLIYVSHPAEVEREIRVFLLEERPVGR